MSKKPKKHSEQKRLNDIMNGRKKQVEYTNLLPPFTYIFCEGEQTEPNYLSGLVNEINIKYSKYTSVDRIIVKGVGRNTRSLLNYARDKIREAFPEVQIVWIVYDKDDFPDDNFDNTQYSIENRKDAIKYHAAWSNECIELWFVLHFQDLNSNIGRDAYIKILDKYFIGLGYNKGYEKNMPNIYDVLKSNTSVAIRRAENLYSKYNDDEPPSKRCPATRIHELVKELQQYL